MKILSALFCVMCLSISACGSDSASKSEDPVVRARDENSVGLNAAAEIVAHAILDGAGQTIYVQMSQECRAKANPTDLTQQLKTSKAYLKSFLGVEPGDIAVDRIETQKVVRAKTGQARYTLKIEEKSKEALERYFTQQRSTSSTQAGDIAPATTSLDAPTQWFDFVYEDDSWRLDDCDDFLSQTGLLSQ